MKEIGGRGDELDLLFMGDRMKETRRLVKRFCRGTSMEDLRLPDGADRAMRRRAAAVHNSYDPSHDSGREKSEIPEFLNPLTAAALLKTLREVRQTTPLEPPEPLFLTSSVSSLSKAPYTTLVKDAACRSLSMVRYSGECVYLFAYRFIVGLDPYYIRALASTVPSRHRFALPRVMFRHLAAKSAIEVRVPVCHHLRSNDSNQDSLMQGSNSPSAYSASSFIFTLPFPF